MTSSPVLQAVAQITLYLVKLVAVWLFLRGHQHPGGGFIAALVMTAAIALQGIAFGWEHANRILPYPTPVMVGLGLFLAVGTGTAGPLLGLPFLTHGFVELELPVLGHLELASAAVFDLGVFLVVVAGAKAILLALAMEKVQDMPVPGESVARGEGR